MLGHQLHEIPKVIGCLSPQIMQRPAVNPRVELFELSR